MGTAVDDFLAEMLPQQVAAETAIHNGDVAPRLALWSRNDPVTVFGAKRSATGWADLNRCSIRLRPGSPTQPNTTSRWWPRAPAATWPTPSAMSTTE